MPYKTVIAALSMKGDETRVIDEAVRLANSFGSHLIVAHVNDPHAGSPSMMMDSPGLKITEEDIRNLFREAGHEEFAPRIEVQLPVSESIPKALKSLCERGDLLILGHRRMTTFREHFMDSIDEGIVNHVSCPVLIVQKGDKKG
ncbi:MAG: universal stress protein [Candidatus Neomarinimicrobiota bacterium]|nr:MAG: universal stress protein [Candidatus Neomarinimicrobiota bacterium]